MSGESIAAHLGCSRAAVHRHVAALRREGIAILGVHEGYVLAPEADPVIPAMVQEQLTGPIAGPVVWHRSTGSTNDDLAAAARDGAPEGLVIGADVQTAGRGRRGRSFVTQPDDAVLFSILLRPTVDAVNAAFLPIMVAVAVAEALHPDARIVWPNDVIVNRQKICGILCESSADESGLVWAVAGIGINVRTAPELTDARWTAGSLVSVDAPITARTAVATRVLQTLGTWYSRWTEEGTAPILEAYAARDALAGTGIAVQTAGTTLTGTAAGLDETGRLRITTAHGEQAVASGEVVRVEFDPS